MSCPDANRIIAFADGALPELERLAVARHLEACELCLALVASDARPSPGGERPEKAKPPAVAAGTAVGRYLLLELVGSGGMGDVYAAYDPKLGRRVALKLMNERVAAAKGTARFTREAQSVARLSHPNVVAIHDTGEFLDRVYLAMEFVEGQTLAGWLAASPRSWREIRDVFVAAGAGLAAAHEAGLVHRDFKPQNVMVGRDGSVRVMDFGLAADVSELDADDEAIDTARPDLELTTNTLALTRTGTLVGTPLYMAPEQFLRRKTSARTDQFSFCIALHEALYGERPFPSTSFSALVEAVTTGRVREPPRKARVPAFVRRILLRGLAVDPDKRHPSMTELLKELRQDPQRRRRNVALGAALAALVVAGAVGAQRASTRGQRMCRGAADRLAGVWEPNGAGPRHDAVRKALLGTGSSFAEETWQRVATSFDDYGRRWAAMYTDACEATHVRGDQSESVLDLRMSCLQGSRDAMRAVGDVLARADSSMLVHAVNAVQGLPSFDRCADIPALRAVVPPPADRAQHAQVEALQARLADLRAQFATGRWAAARAAAAPLVSEAREVGYQPLLAEALAAQAWVETESTNAGASYALLEEALWLALAVGRDDIAAESAAQLVALSGYRLGRQEEASRWERVATALLQRIGPGHERIAAWFYQDRGSVYERRGEYAAALADVKKALALKQKVVPPDPADIAETLLTLANVDNDRGEHQAALVSADQAVALYRKTYGPNSPQLAHPLESRGEVLEALGRYPEAEADLREAADRWSGWLGADHEWVAYALTALGKTLLSEQRPADAAQSLERALRIREHADPNQEEIAETRFALARAQAALAPQDRASARKLALAAREAYQKFPNHSGEIAAIDAWLSEPGEAAPARK
jgi:tRNA A-37 threonylcarbamoyl transferase component Bud32